jgi:hypothetical protein
MKTLKSAEEIKDYLYKSKELPYWREEVINIVVQIVLARDQQIKDLIEKMIKAITDDKRYHYKTATVFGNAPLALIQTAMEAEVQALTEVINLIKND